jgi:transposase-like protein
VGRPEKLISEIQQKIVDPLRMGNYIETASAYAGITKSTLYEWLKRGAREKRGKYKEFSNAVEKAMAEAERRDIALIAQSAKEN